MPCRTKRGVASLRSALRRSVAGALVLGLALTAFSACSGSSEGDAGGAPATSSAPEKGKPSSTSEAEASPGAPQPVYPRTNEPPDPLAVRFCAAIHTLPAERKAQCCKSDPSITLADECARTLSFALRSKAISLDPAAVDLCVEASAKAFEGCDWVAPLSALPPSACIGVVKGTLNEGDRCRSSLECTGGLHCHGVAASDTGRCGKPRETGACSRGIDTLASHIRDSAVERRHPECAGHCNGKRCEPDLAEGAACTNPIACGEGKTCRDKKCTSAPLPKAGEPCLKGACGEGARCLAGACIAPKKNGEPCADDVECPGTCDKPKGAKTGTCAMLCAAKIPGLIPTH